MAKIFIAFGGRRDQNTDVIKIQCKGNIELLNLEKFTIEELQDYLKEKEIALPYPHIPINITVHEKIILSWGIYYNIDGVDDLLFFEDIVFLLEFYLDTFLNPVFQFSRLGFEILHNSDGRTIFDTYLNGYLSKIDIDNLSKFLSKHQLLSDYKNWVRPRIYDWVKNDRYESFRLFTALGLYQSLKTYNNKKNVFFWKKEIMEMGIILETLFTKTDEKESIGYVLRKRIHWIMGNSIPDIEKTIKDLYDTRSNFVHGSFFEEIKKMYTIQKDGDGEDIQEKYNNDMFLRTNNYLSLLRRIILRYYELFEKLNNGTYKNFFDKKQKITVVDVIEKFMLDKTVDEVLKI